MKSSSSGTHAAGVVLVILGGVLLGGAWSLWTRQPRTTAFLTASLVVAVVAAVLLFSGVTRLG